MSSLDWHVIGGVHHGERHVVKHGNRLRLMQRPESWELASADAVDPEAVSVKQIEYRLASLWHKGDEYRVWVPESVTREGEMAHVLHLALADTQKGGTAHFKCAARANGSFQVPGGGDPQECDWPVCGCDDYAMKVIESLQESGHLRGTGTAP